MRIESEPVTREYRSNYGYLGQDDGATMHRAIVLLNRFVSLVSIRAKSVNCVTLLAVTRTLRYFCQNWLNSVI